MACTVDILLFERKKMLSNSRKRTWRRKNMKKLRRAQKQEAALMRWWKLGWRRGTMACCRQYLGLGKTRAAWKNLGLQAGNGGGLNGDELLRKCGRCAVKILRMNEDLARRAAADGPAVAMPTQHSRRRRNGRKHGRISPAVTIGRLAML